MAKFKIRVDRKTGMTYFPKEIRQEGFVGEVEGLPNALTFTLIKPGTNLVDVARSLRIVLRDIELRTKAVRSDEQVGKLLPDTAEAKSA